MGLGLNLSLGFLVSMMSGANTMMDSLIKLHWIFLSGA